MGQVLSAPLIIAGIVIFVYAVRKKLPQQGLPDRADDGGRAE